MLPPPGQAADKPDGRPLRVHIRRTKSDSRNLKSIPNFNTPGSGCSVFPSSLAEKSRFHRVNSVEISKKCRNFLLFHSVGRDTPSCDEAHVPSKLTAQRSVESRCGVTASCRHFYLTLDLQMNNHAELRGLLPDGLWSAFADLNVIPRPSKNETAVSKFIVERGEQLGLETVVDDLGNVLIRKPASAGYENHPPLVLQSHLDMVWQKNSVPS